MEWNQLSSGKHHMLNQMKHFDCMSKQIDESGWENSRQLENQPSQKSVLLKKIWNAQKSVSTVPKHLVNPWFQVFISQQNLGQSRKSKVSSCLGFPNIWKPGLYSLKQFNTTLNTTQIWYSLSILLSFHQFQRTLFFILFLTDLVRQI